MQIAYVINTLRNLPETLKEKINIELIALCLKKDSLAQRKLYDLLLPSLNGICRRYLFDLNYVKDALQESFVKIFKNIESYDIQKSNFRTWSSKITINTCLKLNQKYKSQKLKVVNSEMYEHVQLTYTVDSFNKEEILSWLKKMPTQLYEVYILYLVDGYAHQEIADNLSISVELSRKRFSRARAWVKQRVNEDDKIVSYFYSN